MKKLILLLFMFNINAVSGQQSLSIGNKILLDSICNYLIKSDYVKGFYYNWFPNKRSYTHKKINQFNNPTEIIIDTINLAIHFHSMDTNGPGKASGTDRQISFYFNYLDPPNWQEESDDYVLDLYIKGDDFDMFVAEVRIDDRGSYDLGRFKKVTTSYYMFSLKFDKKNISKKKLNELANWLSILKVY